MNGDGMKRRSCLQMLLAWTSVLSLSGAAAKEARANDEGHPIQLHLDLAVDPAKEQEMLQIFENEFRPAASRQPGYIDAKMLRLSSTLRGPAPPGSNYQFILTFQNEAARQKWVATPLHKSLWPRIEATLSSPTYSRLLYEVY
jgi:heme-degrading monooxygenase HmoA